MKTQCACPLGVIQGDCPYSFANGWHNQRDAILLQINLKQLVFKVLNLTADERAAHVLRVGEYMLADIEEDEPAP